MLSCFSYRHKNCKIVDNSFLFESLIVAYVKDLKIGTRKLLIEKDKKLALIDQFLTEFPTLNYDSFNIVMALQA